MDKYNIIKIVVLLTITFSCAEFISAQELKVKSIELLTNDLSAQEKPCVDRNGKACALVKIKAGDLKNIEFTKKSQYVKASYDDINKVYLVYIPQGLHKLALMHSDFLPLEFDMADFGYKLLKGGQTYLVQLEIPTTGLNKSIIVIKVHPQNSLLLFCGESMPHASDGIYEIPVAPGSYTYSISAENHLPSNGTVSVEKGQTRTLSKRLKPITHIVDINCNVKDARVFVDNIEYGNVGKLSLPQGKHQIRVQKQGFLDEEEMVEINSLTGSLSYTLKKNLRDATSVTIYSKSGSKNIYKNGRRISEWSNGATIKFKPGKYLLSDDDLNEYEITVGDSPITVRF